MFAFLKPNLYRKKSELPVVQIKSLEEVRGVCLLPCLEELVLHHNPLATIVDYRLKVLEAIGSRYPRVSLGDQCCGCGFRCLFDPGIRDG
jgi:hypothetical protein